MTFLKENNVLFFFIFRSDTTLASLAFQSEEASRKRKVTPTKLDIKPSNTTKKPKLAITPVNQQQKLPRRNTINPGEDNPERLTSSSNEEKPNKKKEPKSESKVKKPEESLAKKVPIGKPFNKLMSDVVFVISGIQNPLRSDIRQKAIGKKEALKI